MRTIEERERRVMYSEAARSRRKLTFVLPSKRARPDNLNMLTFGREVDMAKREMTWTPRAIMDSGPVGLVGKIVTAAFVAGSALWAVAELVSGK